MKMKITGVDEARLKDFVVAVRQIKPADYEKLRRAVLDAAGEENSPEREEGRRILIEQYLKDVVMIAAKYRGSGMSFAELIREGNVGLISAVRNIKAENINDFENFIYDAIEDGIISAVIKNKKEGKARK